MSDNITSPEFWKWLRDKYGWLKVQEYRARYQGWRWNQDEINPDTPMYQEFLRETGQSPTQTTTTSTSPGSPGDRWIPYTDDITMYSDEGIPVQLWIYIPDLQYMPSINSRYYLDNYTKFINLTKIDENGQPSKDYGKEVPTEVSDALRLDTTIFSNSQIEGLYQLAVYESLANEAVGKGLPEEYLSLPDVLRYLNNQAAQFTTKPQAMDVDSIAQISRRLVEDPGFATQMKAFGIAGPPSPADLDAYQAQQMRGQATGGGGYEPGLMGSPVKFAEELGEGIVTPTSATVLAQSREEAEKLGATWWIPDAPGIREIYKTKKEEFERLLSQGYSMEQTPDEAARGLAIEGAKPVQVGQEPPSLTEQFSMPVITQKRLEWESLKKKARSAERASNKQWRVGL